MPDGCRHPSLKVASPQKPVISCNNSISPAPRRLIDDTPVYELHTQESPELWLPYRVFIVRLYWIGFLPIQSNLPIRDHFYQKQVCLAT